MSDPLRLIVAADLGEVAELAAREVRALSRAAIAEREAFHVALAGGSTPRALYARLARDGELDFGRWQVWFGDERCVSATDPASNFRMARETLLETAGIPEAQWHPMRVWDAQAPEAARAYEAELHAALGREPRFDLVLLGMGADGHTASLFAGSSAFAETQRCVTATWVESLRAERVTLTLPTINAARSVVFLVAGEDKAAALAAVLDARIGSERPPAGAVAPRDGELVWIVDRAAAGKLAHERWSRNG